MRRFDHNEVTTKHSEVTTRHNEVTARHNEETTTHKEETTPHNDETTPHKKVMAFHIWRLEIPLNLLWSTKVLYFLFIQLLKTFQKLIIVELLKRQQRLFIRMPCLFLSSTPVVRMHKY